MTTTERIKDKLKHIARNVMDRVHVVAGDAPNTATAARTVIIEHHFAAPPEQVFKAWTDPETATRWYGPEGYTTTDVVMNLQVGGRWANTMVSPDGKRYPSTGVIREVQAPNRLVLFDEGKGEPMNGHATKIEVTFEPSGTGTKMRLVHGVFKTVETRDECKAGWSSSFTRLERMLDGK